LTLHVKYDAGQQVTLSGRLTNSFGPMANQTIDLGGVVSGTATTNSSGTYRVTLPVSQLGTVTAVSDDGISNTAQSTLIGGAPTISNFMAISEGGGLWLFTGTVGGAPAQGEVVTLSGIDAVQGLSTTVSAGGMFIVFATVASGQGGFVDAQAVDWWGDSSEVATTDVNA
jgi:hypothetical protein